MQTYTALSVEALRSLPYFSSMPDVVLQELAQGFDREDFDAFTPIIHKDEMGVCMYWLAEGRVKVHDGPYKIAELEAGALFGEFALLDSEPRSASVTTLTPCVLYRLEQNEFYAIMEKRPQILRGMIAQILQRMRAQNKTIVDGLKNREQELTRKVEERTHELKNQNQKLEIAYQEITLQKAELENAYEEIRTIVENLNEAYKLIDKNNKVLQEKNRSLEEALGTIKTQQAQLLSSEKMAALGEIMPIIAHEINTPLKTINLASENLTSNLTFTLKQLPELFAAAAPETRTLFWKMVEQTMLQLNEAAPTAKEEREAKKRIEQAIEEVLPDQFEDPEDVAFKLAKAGLDGANPDLLLYLQTAQAQPRLSVEALTQTLGYIRHFFSIRKAGSQAVRILTALQNYVSQSMNEEEALAPCDLVADLQMILTLYDFYLRQGVRLTTDLNPIPKILAYEGELNQIWKNTLMFCLHQMNGKGDLKITTLPANGGVEVCFQHNGEPLTNDALQALFVEQPNERRSVYLGLAIARSVVEKHSGVFQVKSENDGVVFKVFLPQDPTLWAKNYEG